MNGDVPRREKLFTEVCASGDAELISLLLETSEEELEALERIYAATDHVRASAATREEKADAIDRRLSEDPSLRDDFRTLTGRERFR